MEDDKSAEENEIFEITDFTNATPWESFVSNIENILIQWGLTSDEESIDSSQAHYTQHQKSEKLTYAKHGFVISLHVSGEKRRPAPKQSDQDWPDSLVHMMNRQNDFPSIAHHITRWYGVEQFVLIAPDEKSEAVSSEAQSKLMISTISMAVSNIGCTMPVFVQIQKHWRHMYTGVCEGNGLRTNFDMVHLKRTPPQFDHLTGMMDIFRSKLRKPSSSKLSPIQIAARITYYLRHWSVEDWPVEPLGDFRGVLSEKAFASLPLGATIDPVQELHLSAIWSQLTEETIIDNSTTSGFNPLYAPLWTVKTNLVENPGLLLNEQVSDFIKICYRQDSIEHLLGNKLIHEDSRTPGVGSSDFSHALTRLTGPPSSLTSFSSVMYSSSSRLEFGTEFEPISGQELDIVLQYLFPDSVLDASTRYTDPSFPEDKIAKQLKSAHPDSFTARLARVLCVVNREYGLKAFAHVWYEVVLELRYRWENGIHLVRLGEGVPDMMTCLLHQKLQMLNCCIQHKISHTRRLHSPSSSSSVSAKTSQEPAEYQTPTSSLSFSQRISSQLSLDERVSVAEEAKEDNNRKGSNNKSHRRSTSTSSSEDEFFEAPESPNQLQQESSLEKSIKALSLDDGSKVLGGGSLSPSVKPRMVDLEPAANDPLSLLDDDDEEGGAFTVKEKITNQDKPAALPDEGRVGALRPYKDLVLLRTGEPLYVPETQDPAPLTEDMLWEQQDVLSKLGTSGEAAQVRAKMQSISLVSDMRSFKAANPGCVLEDFVRWYSPRDWIEGDKCGDDLLGKEEAEADSKALERAQSHPTDGWEEDDWGDVEWESVEPNDKDVKRYVSGHLSLRMRQPGNMWVESWENATPLPVYRQKRLFDDTKEAEKVLHYLSGLKPSELALMLLPLLMHSAVLALQKKQESIPLSAVEGITNDAVSVLNTVQKPTLDSLPIYQECLSLLHQVEHQLAIANSLKLKFQQGLELKSREDDGKNRAGSKELNTSVQILAQDKQELVLREPTTSLTGIALQGLLLAQGAATQNVQETHQMQSFPKAAAREFILRTVSSFPGASSASCPHRMFCLLSKDELRLAAAYSEDILIS